ncbi:hypothetical protein ACLB2K_041730 [Fragaria x ananassa]
MLPSLGLLNIGTKVLMFELSLIVVVAVSSIISIVWFLVLLFTICAYPNGTRAGLDEVLRSAGKRSS